MTMANFSTTLSDSFRPNRFFTPLSATQRTTVAISACLTGEKVRYDGADKQTGFYPLLRSELNLVPICPEVGAGLGVPRPPVQLVATIGNINALGRHDPTLDITIALQDFAEQSLQQLRRDHLLCGYLLKSRSPSCGFGSTPIFNATGTEIAHGSGIHADHFQRHLPYLSYCEETVLQTESAVMRFVLRCRLVFDVLYASDATLLALHRHYTFLHENFDADAVETLRILSAENNTADYLTTLLANSAKLPEDVLLNLFH